MLAIVARSSALFIAGVAFAFYVVLPVALQFLLDFGGDTFQTQVRAGEYFGFVTSLMLACGLMFEVPVAMLALRPASAWRARASTSASGGSRSS